MSDLIEKFVLTFGAVLLVTVLLLGGLALTAGPARSQSPGCGALAEVLTGLHDKWHESIVWQGIAANGDRFVITAAPDGSTWTGLVVTADVACLAASGTGWTAPVPTPAGQET